MKVSCSAADSTTTLHEHASTNVVPAAWRVNGVEQILACVVAPNEPTSTLPHVIIAAIAVAGDEMDHRGS